MHQRNNPISGLSHVISNNRPNVSSLVLQININQFVTICTSHAAQLKSNLL